jgi:glycosidase
MRIALLARCVGPLLLALSSAATFAQAGSADAPVCSKDPLGGRSLYLRGTFNSWNAVDRQRFTWACNRYELVTSLQGEHRFKLGDEGWSADADFGAPAGAARSPVLALRGQEISRNFSGVYRLRLSMSPSLRTPTLDIESCPAQAPLGDTVLFLRGSMNNWAAVDDFQFRWSCDAYYLNVKVTGRHDFKLADVAWSPKTSFGADPQMRPAAGATGNLNAVFTGEHTLRLAFVDGKPDFSIGPKTFADPTAQQVSHPVALSLKFDSRAPQFKQPFGAVVAGTLIRYSLAADKGVDRVTLVIENRRLEGNQEVLEYSTLARLPMQRRADGSGERWEVTHRFEQIGVYGYWFEVQIGDATFVYQNNSQAVFWTREKGSGGLGAVADKPASTRTVRRFRQTVYSADFKVPEWAPDTVYYYIFPDRFRNGDRSNDPRPGGGRTQDRYHDKDVEFHANWNSKPFRPGTGDGSDAHFNNDFFGGDLAGIIEKLDYIKSLGANAIYMTPVFQASSNHKYDTADYTRVDPAFGTNEDFARLTREAARRGIRIIPDTSLNHTGSDSIYFDRFGKYASRGAFEGGKIRKDSPYASWYRFDETQTDPNKQYTGWVGVADLPELDKASPAWRDFAYRKSDSVMKQWLDLGAAGWRMDVAPWVPDDFWREWRAAIRAHTPDAITIAETWFDSSKYFLGDMFDSTMNYIFRNAVLEYAAGGNAKELWQNIELMREAYPPQAFYALMNLLSSHDQARSLHVLGWHEDSKPDAIALAKQRYKLAVLVQMTFPGSPAIYYGDEVSVTGGDDPYNRATYPWADLGGRPDEDMLAWFRKLTALRNQHAVLRRGSIDAPLFLDERVVVLHRALGDEHAIVLLNNAETERAVALNVPDRVRGRYLDLLTGERLDLSHRVMQVNAPARGGRVLVRQK